MEISIGLKRVISFLKCIYFQQCKGKYQRAILYVSGDALRVVDEISKVRSDRQDILLTHYDHHAT